MVNNHPSSPFSFTCPCKTTSTESFVSYMEEPQSIFEELCLPHLEAAYNLARWLVGKDQDAEDVVQEAYFRALKGFKGFSGENARAWLMGIVRRAAYDRFKRRANQSFTVTIDPAVYDG